tara:strand:- start:38294 stop:39415 length:1122 start_codon:yes stop_codon:yes gene_type:complete
VRILVINVGSSSVKLGVVENGVRLFRHSSNNLKNITNTLDKISNILALNGYKTFDAIGHRVVHGGETFKDSCLIDSTVIDGIESCVPLAPLHLPHNLVGIRLAQKIWPDVPQIATFDTAFHQKMPQKAVTYAVTQKWRNLGLRRYGFHGSSHKYVMQRVAEELNKPSEDLRIISCHLGNGASVCAIEEGVSVDTSMGMTALEGLVMGTRSGDVDPGLFAFLYRTQGLLPDEIEKYLYNECGLKGLTGINDMRMIEQQVKEGDEKAILAIDVYAYRARKYVGAYAAAMSGVDVLAFTGGIGEHSATIRRRICEGFEFMGLHFDENKNVAVKLQSYEAPQIQKENSRVKVLVTQTREQWMIAKEVEQILNPAGYA